LAAILDIDDPKLLSQIVDVGHRQSFE